jgi:hypothetical protein
VIYLPCCNEQRILILWCGKVSMVDVLMFVFKAHGLRSSLLPTNFFRAGSRWDCGMQKKDLTLLISSAS